MDATAIRLRRGRLIHATPDYVRTACGLPCVGATLRADAVPTCKACLRVLLGENR